MNDPSIQILNQLTKQLFSYYKLFHHIWNEFLCLHNQRWFDPEFWLLPKYLDFLKSISYKKGAIKVCCTEFPENLPCDCMASFLKIKKRLYHELQGYGPHGAPITPSLKGGDLECPTRPETVPMLRSNPVNYKKQEQCDHFFEYYEDMDF